MIRHLLLTAALIPAASMVTDACAPAPPMHVQADCTDLTNGFTFHYDGTEAGMPAGCTIIGTGDAGDPQAPAVAGVTPSTVTFDAGGSYTGRADPRDVNTGRSTDLRVVRCTVEDGHEATYAANQRPVADVDADLAAGICRVVPS